jgi:serine/threonine protein kinase
VTDFGLAKLLDESLVLTTTTVVMGTPLNMAPEQATGTAKAVGPRADVYSLGAMLYELLVGRPPLVGQTALEILAQVLSAEVPPVRRRRADVPRDLVAICQKCLQKLPKDRYPVTLLVSHRYDMFLPSQKVRALLSAKPSTHKSFAACVNCKSVRPANAREFHQPQSQNTNQLTNPILVVLRVRGELKLMRFAERGCAYTVPISSIIQLLSAVAGWQHKTVQEYCLPLPHQQLALVTLMASIFHSLLLVIAGSTQKELARQVRYLKVENEILRSKLPARITVTPRERQRLLKFGAKLGRAIRQLVTTRATRSGRDVFDFLSLSASRLAAGQRIAADRHGS